YVWFFGAGILVQLAIASAAALAGEAAMLAIRGKPKALFLTDLSAIVTAWLIALTFPPIVPWWLTVTGTLLAVVVVKQLYGGLGQNPFNPAMAAFCLMIVAYPALMSQWPAPGQLDFTTQLDLIFGGARAADAITGATPLDALRTALKSAANPDSPLYNLPASQLMDGPAFGTLGGQGSEWVALGYLLGGLWLIQRRIITWHIPFAFCAALFAVAGLLWAVKPAGFASPLFHLASGGSMLGAFFILTDPVSGATTPRGKLLFAAGAACLTYIIRAFGAYPDGIAFATLLMNILVPLIDMKTQSPVFGHKKD
ncbi:MAG TPA: RnfABCDGE type electron transport complex subunit D, partial [Rhodocyclaceae bacterium]|nr:RnfABCDGE type electron transport complex subunit D [Rhodocyclaceae bacterium]